ncbi:MAG: chlorite dismutase family protein [Pseudomonadota bacterium]
MKPGSPLLVRFVAGRSGRWDVTSISCRSTEALGSAPRLEVLEGEAARTTRPCFWQLRGVTSHLRYTTASESVALKAVQPPLARPSATRAALIPIRKSAEWWQKPQDERRAVYEERSRHTSIGMEYLPRIARRLHHCRDLGEPFDFLTWFEFAPEDEAAFDELLARLRATEEWRYVDREVEVRLTRREPE